MPKENNIDQCKILFNTMLDGFALHEIVLDENGKPCDYIFLEVNKAFESMTGLKAKDIIGKRVLEILPKTEKYWIETYGNVAITGKAIRFENYSKEMDKYYDVSAFSPQKNQFAVLFLDITARKETEKKLQEALDESKKMLSVITDRELKMIELKKELADLKKKLNK